MERVLDRDDDNAAPMVPEESVNAAKIAFRNRSSLDGCELT
jgi:hypothetical protein